MGLNPTGMPNLTLLIALGNITMKALEQTLSSLRVYFGSVSPVSFVCEKLAGPECYASVVNQGFETGLVSPKRMTVFVDVTNKPTHPIQDFGFRGLPTWRS